VRVQEDRGGGPFVSKWGPDEELFDFYQKFRGVPAPVNEYTEALWAAIELGGV
jgi:hypothetical protein